MTASRLYGAIRAIAFPQSPNLDSNTDARFILMIPGKVLNYHDYYPGEKYTKFLQERDSDMKFAVVPPHVMEKWFDLADVIPSANPLYGQETGRSFANIYGAILKDTTITNLQEQGEQVLAGYNQALGFLNKVIPDPENLEKNTTRLTLYDRYKELYNKAKLKMEDEIELQRKTQAHIDYELWFQRHYPLLLASTESAYVRWLIFGQKELCDIYITYLDSGASAKTLEEARVIMRSAGATSLDRTRTIYPVSFEPSDWYKYILPNLEKPSRAELNEVLSRIQTKIATIEGVIFFYKTSNTKLDGFSSKLEDRRKDQTKIRNNTLSLYLENELECTASNMGIKSADSNSCNTLTERSTNLSKYLANEADSRANAQDFNWGTTNKEEYINSLEAQLKTLVSQRQNLKGLLGEVDPLFGGILNYDQLTIANILDSQKGANWLQFSFDSEEYKEAKDFESSYESISASARVGGWFFSAGYSYSRSKSSRRFQQKMSQSSLKAKGEFLKVRIKRPWFKPEVFDDRNLKFIQNTEDGAKVLGSPGSGLSEKEFIDAITGGKGTQAGRTIYRLPEYVTAFLLARNVELVFSNVDGKTVRESVSSFTHHSGYASFFCFSSSFSYTRSNSKSKSRIHRTANGMAIKIPGAQIIGYYTQKLPKFPASA